MATLQSKKGKRVELHRWAWSAYFPRVLELPSEACSLAQEKDFEIKAYGIGAAKEQTNPPRLVRVAVVQNVILRPTTDPIKDQVRGEGREMQSNRLFFLL